MDCGGMRLHRRLLVVDGDRMRCLRLYLVCMFLTDGSSGAQSHLFLGSHRDIMRERTV